MIRMPYSGRHNKALKCCNRLIWILIAVLLLLILFDKLLTRSDLCHTSGPREVINGGYRTFYIRTTWNGDCVTHEPVKISLSPSSDGGATITVEAPYFNSPAAPNGPAGQPFAGLWDYEVVEAFFLNDNNQYLEVELGPHGQHLLLILNGERQMVKDQLALNYTATISGDTWTGQAVLPRSYFPPAVTKFNAYAIHGEGDDRTYESLYPAPWTNLSQIFFRNHVHSPRPSAGLYVEDEQQESHEVAEKIGCPFTGRRRSSRDSGEARCCSAKVLSSLRRKNDENGCDASTTQVVYGGRGEGRDRRRSCHYDFRNLFQGSRCMVEAISWGSAILWGQDDEKRRHRTRLLYRILFAVPGSEKTLKAIKDARGVSQSHVTEPRTLGHLAIKDAAGAAHDAAVNISKAETLDSALEEFQSMCSEYQARYESLQGLEAAEHGDFASAVEHLRSSCMLGNMSACFNLGLCYETGSGVLKDLEKAKHYYKKAARSGHRMALYNLGLLYIKCTAADVDEEDVGAAALCGCGCKKSEGISLLEKAAKLGLAQAQTYLGIHHIEENEDVDKAVPYFKAAAQQNDAEAQYFLAICYEQGWGVEINECRAAQLYSLAASAGHEAALYNLAVFNEEGHGGLPEDQAAAVELYQKAAELGHEQARVRLEEIRASRTAAVQDWNKKVASFQQLYQQHHTDHNHEASASHHTTSLSPAASSPDLTQYLYKGLSFFFGEHQAMDKGHLPTHDPGGHHRGAVSHKRSLMFQLGGSEESDGYEECTTPSSSTPRSSANESFENDGDESYLHHPGNFHRSYTSPNFSMIACNI